MPVVPVRFPPRKRRPLLHPVRIIANIVNITHNTIRRRPMAVVSRGSHILLPLGSSSSNRVVMASGPRRLVRPAETRVICAIVIATSVVVVEAQDYRTMPTWAPYRTHRTSTYQIHTTFYHPCRLHPYLLGLNEKNLPRSRPSRLRYGKHRMRRRYHRETLVHHRYRRGHTHSPTISLALPARVDRPCS